jgi:glycosyltransferase involved in cell wall biosynthesis
MNILYICTPSSIHDQKWMRFFSDKLDYQVYAIGESVYNKDSIDEMDYFKIKLLPSLNTFSIKSPFKTIESIKKIQQYCDRYQIDLVHVLSPTPYALWLNFVSIPSIITTRGSDILEEIPKLKSSGIKGRFYFILFKRCFKKSHVTCTSIKQIENVKKIFGVDASLVRTGIDINKIINFNSEPFNFIALEGKKIIFSPRFINNPIYGIEIQINAISQLPFSLSNEYVFVFIKKGDYKREYFESILIEVEKKLTSQGISVLILEHLNQENLWKLFAKSSLVLNTPITDGTPNSVLEAMALKIPIILSNFHYDKDIFEGVTFKMVSNNPEELAKLIEKALNKYPKDMIVEAYDRVNLYGNREVEMGKLAKIYSTLIPQK